MKRLLFLTMLLSCVSLVYCQKSKTPKSLLDTSPIDASLAENLPDTSLAENSLSGKQVLASQESPTDNASQRRAFFRCAHPDKGYIAYNKTCLKRYKKVITLRDCEETADRGHHRLSDCFQQFKGRISLAECKNLYSRLPKFFPFGRGPISNYLLFCNKNDLSNMPDHVSP